MRGQATPMSVPSRASAPAFMILRRHTKPRNLPPMGRESQLSIDSNRSQQSNGSNLSASTISSTASINSDVSVLELQRLESPRLIGSPPPVPLKREAFQSPAAKTLLKEEVLSSSLDMSQPTIRLCKSEDIVVKAPSTSLVSHNNLTPPPRLVSYNSNRSNGGSVLQDWTTETPSSNRGGSGNHFFGALGYIPPAFQSRLDRPLTGDDISSKYPKIGPINKKK